MAISWSTRETYHQPGLLVGREKQGLILCFVVWRALISSWWLVWACTGESYLVPTEISSFVLLVRFRDWGHRFSVRCHLFVSDINQGNEDFVCKKAGLRFSYVAPGTERFYIDLPESAKMNVPWNWGCQGCVEFVVAD